MILSLALIFLVGMTLGRLFERCKLPRLVGMMLGGMLLGPSVLNGLDETLLAVSPALRQFALIVILLKAGLSLNLEDLKRVGRPAVLMSFVPAVFEIAAVVLIAPRWLGISVLDAAVLGAVLGAVSPAVVVPKMVSLMERGYGTDQGIPQMILAGASLDDVFVIVLFSSFLGLEQGNQLNLGSFTQIPVSIVLGLALGVCTGFFLAIVLKRGGLQGSAQTVLLIGTACLLTASETLLEGTVAVSGLLAAMGLAMGLRRKDKALAAARANHVSALWTAAEVLLFVLVGAAVDIRYAAGAGVGVLAVIVAALAVRSLGVLVCLIGTNLCSRERLYCVFSYLPKATVQAAIGGVPLAMGLGCGQIVLTVAVVSILITAPLGAFLMELTYRRLLRGPDSLSDAQAHSADRLSPASTAHDPIDA